MTIFTEKVLHRPLMMASFIKTNKQTWSFSPIIRTIFIPTPHQQPEDGASLRTISWVCWACKTSKNCNSSLRPPLRVWNSSAARQDWMHYAVESNKPWSLGPSKQHELISHPRHTLLLVLGSLPQGHILHAMKSFEGFHIHPSPHSSALFRRNGGQ